MTKQQFINNTLSTLLTPSRTSSSAPTPARSGSPTQNGSQEVELTRKQSLEPMATPTVTDKGGPPISIQNPGMRMKRSGSVNSWKGSLSREPTKDSFNSSTSSGQNGSSPSVPMGSPSGTITENSSLNGSTVSFHDSSIRRHNSGQGSVASLPLQKAWESDVESYLKVKTLPLLIYRLILSIRTSSMRFVPVRFSSRKEVDFLLEVV